MLRSMVTLALLAAAACAPSPPPLPDQAPKRASALPFAIDKLAASFTGTVDDVVFVDGYVYVSVALPTNEHRWCVSLKKRVVRGDTVDVKAFGRADQFHSKKLDRDFASLWFAVLTVTTQQPGEST